MYIGEVKINIRPFVFSLMILLIFLPIYGQSWKVVYEHPNCCLNDIFFVNHSIGWIVGSDGIVLHSNDSGYSWHKHNIGTDAWLFSVYFTNTEKGWIVGASGEIYHTADAGSTWISQESGTTDPMNEVFFYDDSTGWIVSNFSLLKSTNGGETWVLTSVSLENDFRDMHFINENEGWIAGADAYFDNFNEPRIWHTSDGGETWDRRDPPEGVGPLWSIFFLNSNLGWTYSINGVLLKTEDGGLSWNIVLGGLEVFGDVTMTDSNNVWVSDYNHIIHSYDGGITWINEWDRNEEYRFFDPEHSILDPTHGWVVCERTVISNSERTTSIPGDYGDWYPLNPSLKQNYPNPFNPQTTIEFSIPRSGIITLTVYDVLGRNVKTLLNRHMQAGYHKVQWDASSITSGIYLIKMQTGSFSQVRKMMIVR